jgi:hypothetical protein
VYNDVKKRTGVLLVATVVFVGLFAGAYHIDSGLGESQESPENVSKLKNGSTDETEDRYTSKPESYPTEGWYVNKWSVNSSTGPREWIPESEFSVYEAVDESEIHTGTTHEVTRYPGAEPTDEQLDAAWELYNQSFEAAEENGWFSFENGTKDGYELLDNLHYINVNHTLNSESLNPDEPENLMYFSDNGTKVLVGYMYLKHNWSAEGQQVGGPLTVWHYHPVDEWTRERFVSLAPDGASIPDYLFAGEQRRYRSPEMIHVWFVRHPQGPFATGMEVPSENIKQPERMSEREFKNYTLEAHERRFDAERIVPSGDS